MDFKVLSYITKIINNFCVTIWMTFYIISIFTPISHNIMQFFVVGCITSEIYFIIFKILSGWNVSWICLIDFLICHLIVTFVHKLHIKLAIFLICVYYPLYIYELLKFITGKSLNITMYINLSSVSTHETIIFQNEPEYIDFYVVLKK